MKLFFDTSALIASLIEDHTKHHAALKWIQKAKLKSNELYLSAHSIAECFAVLTRYPTSPIISPAIAHNLISKNYANENIIALTQKEYLEVIHHMREHELSGGIIYDAIIFQAAIKAKADKLITANAKHFSKVYPEYNHLIEAI